MRLHHFSSLPGCSSLPAGQNLGAALRSQAAHDQHDENICFVSADGNILLVTHSPMAILHKLLSPLVS